MINYVKGGIVVLLVLVALGFASTQSASTNLETEVLQTEPAPLQAGEYATVWIRVTNTGNAEATDPHFELVDSFPFQATDRSEWNPSGGLQPGESYDIRAQVKVNENAVFGNNSLELRTSADGNNYITRDMPLEIRTDDRSLIISDLDFSERVEPGSSSQMNITLENLANSNFRNIDISLNVEELPIAPMETTRKRIRSLGPNSTEQVSFTIDVDGDADNQLYQLPIQIDYQNQAGQEISVAETTGVNVGGYPNIDVAVDDSDIRTPGKGTMTFRIINRGEGQARFAEVQLEESDNYEILSEDSIYLGSMIADDYQTAEFELYVNDDANGTLEMPVTVNYRDGEGSQTEQFNVQRELYTSDEIQRYGLQNSGSPWLLVIPLIVLLGGGLYYWRRRKRRD